MSNAVKGFVCHFKGDPSQLFGHIQVEGVEKNVYFHMSRQQCFYCDGSNFPAYFSDSSVKPEIGDEVILEIDFSDKRGPRAKWWGFVEEHEAALEAIRNRPRIRFMWRIGRKKLSRLQEAPEIRNLWEGSNIYELRKKLSLTDYPIIDLGHTSRYFEKFNPETNCWEPLDTDPRIIRGKSDTPRNVSTSV